LVARERPRSGASDAASWCCVVVLVLVVGSLAGGAGEEEDQWRGGEPPVVVVRGPRLAARWPCEELYVVAEGETLHGISARCGDPYILERNPHVHDTDDVFPGLVLRIAPFAGGHR
ncbi:hypothetical protein PVAP13_9NG496614, partial [Panicum virgatum]